MHAHKIYLANLQKIKIMVYLTAGHVHVGVCMQDNYSEGPFYKVLSVIIHNHIVNLIPIVRFQKLLISR